VAKKVDGDPPKEDDDNHEVHPVDAAAAAPTNQLTKRDRCSSVPSPVVSTTATTGSILVKKSHTNQRKIWLMPNTNALPNPKGSVFCFNDHTVILPMPFGLG
jgi:hypothetical protein